MCHFDLISNFFPPSMYTALFPRNLHGPSALYKYLFITLGWQSFSFLLVSVQNLILLNCKVLPTLYLTERLTSFFLFFTNSLEVRFWSLFWLYQVNANWTPSIKKRPQDLILCTAPSSICVTCSMASFSLFAQLFELIFWKSCAVYAFFPKSWGFAVSFHPRFIPEDEFGSWVNYRTIRFLTSSKILWCDVC